MEKDCQKNNEYNLSPPPLKREKSLTFTTICL